MAHGGGGRMKGEGRGKGKGVGVRIYFRARVERFISSLFYALFAYFRIFSWAI